jgi:hypothetical protein
VSFQSLDANTLALTNTIGCYGIHILRIRNVFIVEVHGVFATACHFFSSLIFLGKANLSVESCKGLGSKYWTRAEMALTLL